MAEAMACGTPVIAFARGAAPELIVQGRTGYLVHDMEQMAKAVYLVEQIDPRDCREHVKRNFDKPQMVRNYIAAYEKVLSLSAVMAGSHHIFSLPPHDISPKPGVIERISMDSSLPSPAQNTLFDISKNHSVRSDTVIKHPDKDVKTGQEGLPSTEINNN